jgi:tetratricopeptide (TPR) repeat protein
VKHYMVFAARMAEIGDGEVVLRTGSRIREILAGDPEVRERLGEIFLALSLPDEGIVDLRAALNGYRERSRVADADRIAQRLQELERSRPVDPLALMEEGAAETPLALDPALLAGSPFEPRSRVPGEPPGAGAPRPEAAFGEDVPGSLREEPFAWAGEETVRSRPGEPEEGALPEVSHREPAGLVPYSPEVPSENVEVLSPGRASRGPEHAPSEGSEPAETGSGEEDFVPVREILREFQNGVSRIIGAGDFQSHYDMGMSYKEMGLCEEALREFEIASGSPELAASSEEMRADILIELGRFQECAHLLRGLVARDENNGAGIHFLLGLAYEKLGESELALREYRLVEERDPDFRDVRVRIAQLR